MGSGFHMYAHCIFTFICTSYTKNNTRTDTKTQPCGGISRRPWRSPALRPKCEESALVFFLSIFTTTRDIPHRRPRHVHALQPMCTWRFLGYRSLCCRHHMHCQQCHTPLLWFLNIARNTRSLCTKHTHVRPLSTCRPWLRFPALCRCRFCRNPKSCPILQG